MAVMRGTRLKNGAFNPVQLSTWDEAKEIAKVFLIPVDGSLIGGGLATLTNNVNTSGIYLPSWFSGGVSPEPQIGNSKWYHFRFKNGFYGVNVGLVRDLFSRYPNSPLYVLSQLKKEIG